MSQTFLSQSVPGPSALGTFTRSVDPQQLQTYLALEQAELLRLRRYNEYWRFYLGQHWQFTREGGEPLITLNYCRRIINKVVDWMVGKGMVITTAEPLRNHVSPVLDEVWEYNNQLEWLQLYACTGGVTGDVFALVTFEQPTPQARRQNPHTQGRIRLQLLGSEQVFPTWDPLNKDVLLQVRIETLYYDAAASASMQDQASAQQRHLHVLRYTQIITRDKIVEQFQGGEPKTRDNVLGEIGLVHVANQLIPGEYYGLSDIDGLTNINREVNEKVTDVSDIINYGAAPVTVITGAKAGNLERSPKQIWSGLPADARVTTLGLETDLSASLNHIRFMREVFMELSSVPESSLGKEQQISNTSAAAMHVQYMPLVEVVNRKTPQYTRGIREINYFILRIKEIIDPAFRLPTDLCKHCGGKIVELAYPDGTKRRRCYKIDPQTFDFIDPGDVKIKHVRQHSFGPSIEERPASQVEAEHNVVGPSAWDPATPVDAEAEHDKQQSAMSKQMQSAGAVPDPPATYTPPQLTKPDLPHEPEVIRVQLASVDPNTGMVVPSGLPVDREVVWTGCEKPNYLNPYDTKVVFKDVLPKDALLSAQWHKALRDMKAVSAQWVREQTPEIENPEQEAKRVEAEDQQIAMTAAQAGGHAPGTSSAHPPKQLGATPPAKRLDDAGTNAAKGGDAVQPDA